MVPGGEEITTGEKMTHMSQEEIQLTKKDKVLECNSSAKVSSTTE